MVLYGPPSQVTYTRVGPSRFLQFVLEASSSWAFHRRWPHKQTSRHIIMSTHRWIDMYAIYATYAYAHVTCMNTYSLKGTCMVVMYLECSNDMIFLKSCSAMFSHCMCMVSISRHIESMPVCLCVCVYRTDLMSTICALHTYLNAWTCKKLSGQFHRCLDRVKAAHWQCVVKKQIWNDGSESLSVSPLAGRQQNNTRPQCWFPLKTQKHIKKRQTKGRVRSRTHIILQCCSFRFLFSALVAFLLVASARAARVMTRQKVTANIAVFCWISLLHIYRHEC